MKPSFRLGLLALALCSGAACSGGNGNYIDGTRFPTGDIVLSNPQTGASFSTSASHPYPVSGNSFSIGISEKDFSGPYSITSYSYDTGFNEPCYVPHLIDGTDQVNIYQFRPDNASPISNGTIEPNPCNPDFNDLEVWLINDGKGHDLYFYTLLPENPVPTSTASARRSK